MKKIAVIGIVILLVTFMVTCDVTGLPKEEEVEYTDVEYSDDGSMITVYLDGKGVPVTKAQRSMSKDLALMAFDFIEVIFVSGTNIARTSWELGQPAGISGVYRTAVGIDYANSAYMFVGKRDGKTLLGVGKMVNVDHAGTYTTTLTDASTSVTFAIAALQTGLLVGAETVAANDRGVLADCFTAANTTGSISSLGKVGYPTYSYAKTITAPSTQTATYTFKFVDITGASPSVGAITTFTTAVKHRASVTHKPLIQKRLPRFMEGGAYKEPKNHIDTKTTVGIAAAYMTAATNGANFDFEVPLTFGITAASVNAAGIFSFNLEIPCFLFNFSPATNSGPDAETWYIRTGLGSEFYSLDDGVSSGGCILMGVGAGAMDWLDIDWYWI